MTLKQRCYSLQIILIRMQSFLLRFKLSIHLMLVVLLEYKLIQSYPLKIAVLSKMANTIRALHLVNQILWK